MRARPGLRRLAVLLLALVTVGAGAALSGASPARAAVSGAAAADMGFDVRLTSLSPAIPRPGGTLTVTGTIADVGRQVLRDVQVYLRVPSTPVTDRDAMAAIAASPSGDPAVDGPLQVDHYAQLSILRPGGTATFDLAVPVDALGLGPAGVYPMTVEVRGTSAERTRVAAADVRTYVPWQIGTGGSAASDAATAARTRIGVGWLVPLTTAAVRVSDSVFVDGTLAASLAPTGRLGRVLEVLSRLGAPAADGTSGAGTTVQVAIDPMLVAEVEAMTRPYRVQDSRSRTTTGTSAALPAAPSPTPTSSRSPTGAPTSSNPTTATTTGAAAPRSSADPAPGAATHPVGPVGSPATSPAAGSPTSTTTTSTTTGTTTGTGTGTGRTRTGSGLPPTALSDVDLPEVHTRAGHGQAVARAWLSRLREIIAGRTVFVLPWSDPDLGAVADPRSQLGQTALVDTWGPGLELVRGLGADPVALAWPSLGTDTATELSLAGRSGARAVLLPTVALADSGAPETGASALATLGAAPTGSPTPVLRADTGLDTALTSADPLLGRQAYLAQTALLATAAAGASGTGADGTPSHPVLAVLPRDWNPSPTLVLGVLLPAAAPSWIIRAPIVTSSPAALAGLPTVTLRRHLAVLALQHPRDPAAATPQLTPATRLALAALAGQTASLGHLLTQPALTRQGLRAQRLQLASADLVDRPLRWHRLAGEVSRTVLGIRRAVTLVPPNPVSLSSGTARFPIIVANSLSQPVRVRVAMSTANRTRLEVASVPPVTLPAGQRSTLEIQVDTHTHGLVEVQAVLTDTAGAALEAPLSFAVHSNSYDQIGWVIIVGAGALLFGATAVRLGRRIHRHARNARA